MREPCKGIFLGVKIDGKMYPPDKIPEEFVTEKIVKPIIAVLSQREKAG